MDINSQIHASFGALMIGCIVSSILFGVFTTQIYLYYRHFCNDTVYTKAVVGLIFILETANQICVVHCTYYYTVTTWVHPLAFLTERPLWSLIIQETLSAIIATLVKGVFVLRVWRFSNKNRVVAGVIASAIVVALVFAIRLTVAAFQEESILTALRNLKELATVSLGVHCVSDILIAVALTWYLRKLRTGFQQSDMLVNTLIHFGISTGLLSAILSVVILILEHTRSSTLEFVALFFIFSKVLAISLMSLLHSRPSHSRERRASICSNHTVINTKQGFRKSSFSSNHSSVSTKQGSFTFPPAAMTPGVRRASHSFSTKSGASGPPPSQERRKTHSFTTPSKICTQPGPFTFPPLPRTPSPLGERKSSHRTTGSFSATGEQGIFKFPLPNSLPVTGDVTTPSTV